MSRLHVDLDHATAIEAHLALGLKKTTLPDSGITAQQPLATIALAAERHSYADNNIRSELAVVDIHPPQDQRCLLPETSRAAFLRIAAHPAAANPVWNISCQAIHRHLDQCGYRLHPFDLHKLEKYLAAITPKPGSYEYWYRQQLSPAAGDHEQHAIDWDNWQQFGKAEQQAFLLQQRRTDPEAARQMLEKHFASAPANLRQMYVAAMAEGLNAADQPFLENLQSDRSSKVVETAQHLLARFPGSTVSKQHCQTLVERLEVHFLSRKIGLIKQKGKKASEALQELLALTQYLPIEDIAAALNLAEDKLPGKIAQELAFPFAGSAAFSHRYALALAFLEKEDKDFLLGRLRAIINWFEHAAQSEKLSLAETVTTWLAGADALDKLQLLPLYDLLEQPLPEKLAKVLINSKAFKTTYLQSAGENAYAAGNAKDALAVCALLMPNALHDSYSAKVANVSFNNGLNPLDYLAFIKTLG